MTLSVWAKEFVPSCRNEAQLELREDGNNDTTPQSTVEQLSRELSSAVDLHADQRPQPPVSNPGTLAANDGQSRVKRTPRAGQPVNVTLQSLLLDTALARKPKITSNAKPKNNAPFRDRLPPSDTVDPGPQSARPQGASNNNNNTTHTGRKKMIIRPSDANKKISKLKKSVLTCQEGDKGLPVDEVDPVNNEAGCSPTVSEDLGELRFYKRLQLSTNSETQREMERLCIEMVSGLKTFQDRLYQRDKVKAKMRQRMYYGLKEALKYVTTSKCQMLLLARDIQQGPGTSGLDQLVDDLIDKAQACRVPIVCALTRRKFQSLTHKPAKVACVAIMNPSGRKEQFERLKELACSTELLATAAVDVNSTRQEEDHAQQKEQTRDMLESWTSTTRRGRFEFAVDKLF